MNLHRVAKKPDWELTQPAQRNYWQRMATLTHGYVTPGNAITLTGALLVVAGDVVLYAGAFLLGLVLILAGRIADILDGIIAEHTGTKSAFGEALDAGIDKLVIFVSIIIFLTRSIIPLIPLLLFVLENVMVIVFSSVAKARGREIHPSASGKLSSALQWLALFAFIAAKALPYSMHLLHALLMVSGYCITFIAFGIGLKAVFYYAGDGIGFAKHYARTKRPIRKTLRR
jgi:phosphatidylglycerophosphate synthase